jgi:Notch-like protein
MFSRIATAGLLAALLAGCNPNPFCLNCTVNDGGPPDFSGPQADFAGPDMVQPQQDMVDTGDMCTPSNKGVEACNGVDDDCNGKVDDVDPKVLIQDPNNCGMCGKVCEYPDAFGVCTNGMCSMGACQPNHYDLNKSDKDGCEYNCIVSNGGVEICDGKDNNCDGRKDEGFQLDNDTNNCGQCGNVCTFPNANGLCANGMCAVSGCVMGFKDLNKNGADGCEYKCPVYPPVAETCNGKDDDCNGMIDDNPNDVGQNCNQFCPPVANCVQNNSCMYKLSTCVNGCCGICTQGKTICAGGQKLCQMGMGPSLEICDGKDNNCDGQVDEGFDLQNDPLNCGACGMKCSANNAVPGCKAGVCSILTCKSGFADLDKNPANGCEYTCPVNPQTVESCNGKDDDCNGLVDDALVQPPNFCIQTSICAGAKPVCGGAKGWLCNYQQVNPNIEVDVNGNLVAAEKLCDGFDGNCNTQIDESFVNKGKSCTVGNGACAGSSNFICDPNNKLQTICPATADPTKAVDEACNGLDDDCDGAVDERAPANNVMCYNGGQHVCKGWLDPMVKVGNVWVYAYEASRPDATALKVGVDTSRACSDANVQPWTPITEAAAAAACAAVKNSAGNPMRLCTAVEWSTACNLGNGAVPVWSYAAMNTVYQSMTCNGADRALGVPWAAGTGASCYANQGAGKIFDMSGNVSEWTSTTVAVNNKTYYKVRGGNFNTQATGTNCNFDFTIELPSYQLNDLGFRCCSDAAP